MPIALNLIAPDTEGIFQGIWQAMADFEHPPHMIHLNYVPHITLLRYDDIDLGALERRVSPHVGQSNVMTLQFPSIGCFTDPTFVIFANPIPTLALMQLHHDLSDSLAHPHTAVCNWHPHVTLAMTVPEQNRIPAMASLFAQWQPFQLSFDAVECVRFPPVERLFHLPLQTAS